MFRRFYLFRRYITITLSLVMSLSRALGIGSVYYFVNILFNLCLNDKLQILYLQKYECDKKLFLLKVVCNVAKISFEILRVQC